MERDEALSSSSEIPRRDRAGGENLDKRQPRRLRVVGDLAGEGEKSEPKPLAPILLALGRPPESPRSEWLTMTVVGGEEALRLARKVFVEVHASRLGRA